MCVILSRKSSRKCTNHRKKKKQRLLLLRLFIWNWNCTCWATSDFHYHSDGAFKEQRFSAVKQTCWAFLFFFTFFSPNSWATHGVLTDKRIDRFKQIVFCNPEKDRSKNKRNWRKYMRNTASKDKVERRRFIYLLCIMSYSRKVSVDISVCVLYFLFFKIWKNRQKPEPVLMNER